MRTIRVAVAGLGVVGRETVRLLRQNSDRFAARLGAPVEIAAVCDRQAAREAKALGLPASVIRVTDPAALSRLPRLDIVVELLGGLDAPKRLALESLTAGRHVVTANKRLISHCWPQLQRASRRGGGRLSFEGSVGGGIPLINALESSFAANRIEAVHGILNGTTNYILSAMERGVSAASALAEAQRLGFAEKDPSLDLTGRDTAQKISVLSALLTGTALDPEKIAREGITAVEEQDVVFARQTLGRVPRLLGALRLHWGPVVRAEASVFPTLVPLDHPLAAVRGEYNAVLIKASSADDLMFYGKGAGAGPTASAVAGDVFLLSRDLLGGLPARALVPLRVETAPRESAVSAFYLRLSAQDRPGVLAAITAALARERISIATIHQSQRGRAGKVPVVLTTHPCPAGAFERARRRIGGAGTAMRML
jgi:homoserine dehydrogenase